MANGDVKTANSALEFDTTDSNVHQCIKIDDTHYLNGGRDGGDGNKYKFQVFTISTANGAVTTAGSVFDLDTFASFTISDKQSILKVDTNHFGVTGCNGSGNGLSQIIEINTTTGAITTSGSALTYTTHSSGYSPTCQMIDSTHMISGNHGFYGGAYKQNAQVFQVSTSTGAVTTSASALTFDTAFVGDVSNTSAAIDSTHYILFYKGDGDDGFVQVFTVSTSTGAVTTANARLEFDTQDNLTNSCVKIDANHFINFGRGPGDDGFVQVFTVSTSTGAVTTANSSLEFDTQNCYDPSSCQITTGYFIANGGGGTSYPQIQAFAVNTSTGAVTTAAGVLQFDTAARYGGALGQIDTSHFISFGRGADNDGFVQTFEVTVPGAGPANLKTLNTNAFANIKSINTNLIANVKTYNTQT